jgi:alkylation response protein AidB-like acyl-CoA dehydrogenase
MQRSVQTASVRDDHRLSTLDDVATLREKAGAVTEELAATAVARDRAGRLPTEEIALLRRAGLLQLLVPTESGGPGGDWTDAVTLTRVLSRADGSIGQLLGYHYLNAIIVELLGNPIQVAGLRGGLLQEQWFLGDSVNPLDPGLVVERSDDDIVLNGRKTFSTGAAVADRVLVVFMLGETARFAIVPRDRKGLIANDDWENVGQRLTASGSHSIGSGLGARRFWARISMPLQRWPHAPRWFRRSSSRSSSTSSSASPKARSLPLLPTRARPAARGSSRG